MKAKNSSLGFLTAALAVLLFGCGGQLAKTGTAVVTDVASYGVMRMNYANGKSEWKRINRDNIRKDTETAAENRLKPARYVETRNGGTLTFPNGDTIVYHDAE